MASLKSRILHWGARAGLVGPALSLRGDHPVILMYHGVSGQQRFEGLRNAADLHLPQPKFIEHLQLLRRHRRVIGISELVEGLRNGDDLRKTVVLTFDDGYENNVTHAAPVLIDQKMPASFFLATGFIGTENWIWTDRVERAFDSTLRAHLDWHGSELPLTNALLRMQALRRVKAQLKQLSVAERDEQVAELERMLETVEAAPSGDYRFMNWTQAKELADAGFEIGAHTVHHAILSRVSVPTAEAEIVDSRSSVVNGVGHCCPVFCYPNGKKSDYTTEVIDICKKHFEGAITTTQGRADAQSLFELPRFSAGGDGAALAATLFLAH